jgi:hypothetical protein
MANLNDIDRSAVQQAIIPSHHFQTIIPRRARNCRYPTWHRFWLRRPGVEGAAGFRFKQRSLYTLHPENKG